MLAKVLRLFMHEFVVVSVRFIMYTYYRVLRKEILPVQDISAQYPSSLATISCLTVLVIIPSRAHSHDSLKCHPFVKIILHISTDLSWQERVSCPCIFQW